MRKSCVWAKEPTAGAPGTCPASRSTVTAGTPGMRGYVATGTPASGQPTRGCGAAGGRTEDRPTLPKDPSLSATAIADQASPWTGGSSDPAEPRSRTEDES